jgi:ABC-2 type transport system ATP-binding protein
VCDWLVLIDTGRSIYQGATRDLLDGVAGGLAVAPQRREDSDRLHDLLAAAGHDVEAHAGRLIVQLGGADAGQVAAQVNRAAFERGIVLVELSPVRTTLEERYLTMVEGAGR